MSGFESFDHTIQLTHIWINDLDTRLGWNNKPRSYRLLKSTLHALRDLLPVNEAVDLGAQLPELLRGAYYEGWRPAATPVKARSLNDLTAAVTRHFKADPIPNAAQAVMEVCRLLNVKISPGEIDDVRHAMPEDIRNFWPEPYREPGTVAR
ncbi:MAG: DUF2267 domain-containing protein [Pseudomonadota bacterium]